MGQADYQAHRIEFADQSFLLLPERAVFWERERTLLVADVHLGKAETFQRAGIPIPQAVHDDDLLRLERILRETESQRLLVLGDLFHARAGLTSDLLRRFGEWLDRHKTAVTLVGGNHDRPVLSRLGGFALEIVEEPYSLGGMSFTHTGLGAGPRWSGHEHPVFSVRQGSESLRLPCFHFRGDVAVLPAFGTFTGGHPIRRSRGDRVFLIADNRVIPWTA